MSRSYSASFLFLKLAIYCAGLSALAFLSIHIMFPGDSSGGYLLLAIAICLWPLAALFLVASAVLGTIAVVANGERVPWLPWLILVVLAGLAVAVRLSIRV